MKSILSLPPVLQEVWTAVYAAVIASPHNANAKRSDAEEQAWEAVRRAAGVEHIEAIGAAEEPTCEEMVEALAPIVAAAHSGNAWANWSEQDRPYKIARFELLLQNDKVSADLLERQLVEATLASWKAARAWVKK